MRILAFILAIPFTIPFCIGQAKAFTFFDDSFDNGSLLSSGWTTGSCQYPQPANPNPADGCNPIRTTDLPHTGAYSVKGTYTGTDCVGPGNGCGGVWIDHSFPATTEVYQRWYQRMDGFTTSPITTKNVLLGDANNGSWNFWWMTGIFGGSQFTLGPSWNGYSGSWVNQNINLANWVNGAWTCVETHIKLNDPGVANAIVEMWVDGQPRMSYANLLFRSSSSTGPMPSTATFNYTRIYVQNGLGTIHWDNFAVGNTRIGCTTTAGAADLTPPAPPVGLSIR